MKKPISPLLATLLALAYLFLSVTILVGDWLYLISLIGAIVGLVFLRRGTVPGADEKKPVSPLQCFFSLLVGVGHSLCAVTIVYLLLLFQPPAFDEQAVEMLSTPLVVLGIAVAAPILEEYIFRGILLESYHRRMPFWLAAGLSALAFAVIHLNWQQGTHAFLLGIWTALLLWRTGRILYPALAHIANNCCSAFSSLALTALSQMLPVGAALTLCMVCGLALVAIGLAGVFRVEKRRAKLAAEPPVPQPPESV